MSGGSGEEKSLPPSAKKLQDARKKGQIAKGPDLVTALTSAALIGYLWGGFGWIVATLREPLLLVGPVLAEPFDEALGRLLPPLVQAAAKVVIPALAIAVLSAVAANLLVNGGFILSLHPLAPKFSNVDPIKGLGKLFGVKNMVELAKSVVKAALFGAVMVQLALGAIGPVLQAPVCGTRCYGAVLASVMKPLVAAASGIYLASGLIDLLLQRWLFRREMRMTKTEAKREHKDQDGSPEIKGALRRLRRENAAGGPKLGLSQATLVICGPSAAVGLRYVKDQTNFPFVVCRVTGAQAVDDLVGEARARPVPVFWDDALASGLAATLRSGYAITPDFFKPVARALYASGAVG